MYGFLCSVAIKPSGNCFHVGLWSNPGLCSWAIVDHNLSPEWPDSKQHFLCCCLPYFTSSNFSWPHCPTGGTMPPFFQEYILLMSKLLWHWSAHSSRTSVTYLSILSCVGCSPFCPLFGVLPNFLDSFSFLRPGKTICTV